MSLAEEFSGPNIVNSLALAVADRLMSGGYVVYWYRRDALQTMSGWYYQYSQSYPSLLANAGFLGMLTAAKGVVTFTDHVPAAPRFVTRHISDGSVPSSDAVMVPAVALRVSAQAVTGSYEMGTRVKWRMRELEADCFVRTPEEQERFKDLLAVTFDDDTVFTVLDHDAGTAAEVGPLRVAEKTIREDVVRDGAEATSYEVLLNAALEYVA